MITLSDILEEDGTSANLGSENEIPKATVRRGRRNFAAFAREPIMALAEACRKARVRMDEPAAFRLLRMV